jgi:hypothetical protein
MTHKILITISDELWAMIEDYNCRNPYEKLHYSDIAAKAFHDKVSVSHLRAVTEKVEKIAPPELYISDKPVIPCPICGKMFIQIDPRKTYCSKGCGTKASRIRNKE